MNINTPLQDPINYNPLLRIILMVLIILLTLFLIGRYLYIKKYGKIIKLLKKGNLKNIKDTYISKINELQTNYNNKQSDIRKTSLKLSFLIRQFVFSVTDIQVLNYVLDDVKKINIPELYELMVKLYSPEFSKFSDEDINNVFEKSKNIIINWKI